MLLDDLLESGIVQLGELCQVMNVRNDITQVLLQHHKVILSGSDWCLRSLWGSFGPCWRPRIQQLNNILDLLLSDLDPSHDLAGFYLLEGKNFLQFSLQVLHKGLLILLRPFFRWAVGRVSRRVKTRFEMSLKVVVGDIVEEVIADKAVAQLLAEPAK